MAVTVTDLRTTRNEADATTGWTGTTSLITSDPDPVEATGCVGAAVSTAILDGYHSGASVDLSDSLIYVWALGNGTMATRLNDGIALHLGDGTNRISFRLAGSDRAAFRHAEGPVGWQCLVVDGANLPSDFGVRAGSRANLNMSAITQIGITFRTLSKALGGSTNCFIDIIRHGSAEALQITGGTSGDPGKFDEIVLLDRSTANQRAHGVIRELGAALYGLQGPLRFGNPASGNTYFLDTNATVNFEARGFSATRYRITVVRGTGSTHFQLGEKVGADGGEDGCTIAAAPGVGAEFDADTETDPTDVLIYASVLRGFTTGLGFQSGHEIIASQIDASGTIRAGGASFLNTRITGSTAASAMFWNVATDPNLRLAGVRFASGAAGHALELGPSTPSDITLTDVGFAGYGANGTTNAAVYNNSGKHITLNILDGTAPTVLNGAGASTTVIAALEVRLNGIIDGSTVAIIAEDGGPEPEGEVLYLDSNVTGGTVVYAHNDQGAQPILIRVRKSTTPPLYRPWKLSTLIDGANLVIPVNQELDE